ncbi:porin [Candidatus Pelagibacter sp.]|jgi:outer membrane protein OmpU|nr:porin [Candidatus Pelagibacter sp.]
MTNIKKIGLTALAGSLAATSAFAGALDVTGTAKITYVSQDETEVTGNPYSMSQGIGFSGSGELDNGMTINYGYTMSDAAFSSSTLKLDMGDMGTLSYSDGAGSTGISAYDDKMPTAGEEVWDDLDGQANGIATITNKGTLGYSGSFGGLGISASYNNTDGADTTATAGSSKSVVLSGDVQGATVFIGVGDKSGTTDNNGTDLMVMGVTYTAGAVTVGMQATEIDASAVSSDRDRLAAAVSFAVNENTSISYGMSTVEFEGNTTNEQEDSGVAISHTMGSMTLAAFHNSSENVGGAASTDDSVTEISLAFAF